MIKTISIIFCSLVFIISVYGENLPINKATFSPKIDGKLDDECWKDALSFDKFYIFSTNNMGHETKAYITYDNDAIYAGYYCPYPEGKKPKCVETKRDGFVSRDDCVEFMIDPNATGDRYFQILVNSKGVIADLLRDQGGHVADVKWNGDITAKVYKSDAFWSCEIKVPFYCLEISPKNIETWGINMTRDCQVPEQQLSSIIPGGIFNNATAFLKVNGFNINSNKYAWHIAKPKIILGSSEKNITVQPEISIKNFGDKAQDIIVGFFMEKQNNVYGHYITNNFKSNSDQIVKFPPIKIKDDGEYKCAIGIFNKNSREILKWVEYPMEIKFSAFTINLEAPNYRNSIFASQELKNVLYEIKANVNTKGKSITTGIKDIANNIIFEKEIKSFPAKIVVPVSSLPYGKMKIFVDNKELGNTSIPLRKLKFREGEVWRDKDGFWRRNKERFFLIAEWATATTKGVNIAVRPQKKGVLTLDMTMMYSRYPAKKSYKLPFIPPKYEAIIRNTVKDLSKNDSLFGYYLADEPEIFGISASGLTQAANFIRDEDPYHPIIISNNSINGMIDFANANEFNGLHPYPNPNIRKPRSNFDRVFTFMEMANSVNKNLKNPVSIIYLQQGFNYGDVYRINSRIPTFDEIRTQFLITIIMGGQGILFYTRTEEHYPELYIGNVDVAKEFNKLSPIFLANNIPVKVTEDKNVYSMVKKVDGHYWILATVKNDKSQKVKFSLPELNNKKLYVWRENRIIEAKNGKFEDTFNNYDVHIYTTNPDKMDMETLQSVEDKIAKINKQRRKKGNLAFQEFENDLLKITSSSNKFDPQNRRFDNTLWHITDGVYSGTLAKRNHGGGVLYFHDATKNKVPDWIALEFPKVIEAKRVVVYPAGDSLKDYQVEAWIDNKWKVLGSVKNAKGIKQEFKFSPIKSKKFRIFATANNGAYTKIHEFEIYND